MFIRGLVIFATHLASIIEVYSKKMEGFMVEGKDVTVEEFPHSVFLAIECSKKEVAEQFVCGGSIINQYFVLTAAHCYDGCNPQKSLIVALFGATNYLESTIRIKVKNYKPHEKYNSNSLRGDLALANLQSPVKFNLKVQRVYLMRNPPIGDVAEVAGWGLIDEDKGTAVPILQGALQKILSREKCLKILKYLPTSAFCATSMGGYAAEGDSGSALVMHKFIQIGIISYKDVQISVSVIVYTNVSDYYDWILSNMNSMNCR